MVHITPQNAKKYEALARFVKSLHHINDEHFVYSFDELDRYMEMSGLIGDKLWGHLITSRKYIHEGIDIETEHGKRRLIFEPKDDGYLIRAVKVNEQ